MRNPVMIGERVYLRPLEPEDAEALAAIFAAERETFFTNGRELYSPIALERWISDIYQQQPPDEIQLAACLTENDRLLGHVGVTEIDYVNRTGETESYLGPAEYRSQGYGTEAKHLLLEYCFDRLQLHVIRSLVWEPNTRSAAALAKQGYRPAGRLKWAAVQQGTYRDMLVFDLKREEWLAARNHKGYDRPNTI